MTYFMVMGGLALSVCFTFGWVLWRSGQWLLGRLPGKGAANRRQSAKRQAPSKTPTPRRPAARARSGKAAKPAKTSPRQPWGLTHWLARRRFALPLSLLAMLLYGATRLVEYGMASRPHEAPVAYHGIVEVLGWCAAVLLAMALINLLASWRCRGAG